MRLLLCSLGVAAALVTAPACGKAKSQLSLDTSTLTNEITTRENQVFAGAKADAAMNGLLAAVAKDPAFAAAGGTLFDTISNDPAITAGAQAIMTQLTASPELAKLVVDLMQAHPGATPDQMGELLSAKFGAVWETPDVLAAFSSAFDQMIGALHAKSRFEAAWAKTGSRIDAYFSEPTRIARWEDRLRELDGGKDPDPARATQLYLDHAWSSERMETFLVKVLANPTVIHEGARLAAEVMANPAFVAQLRQTLAEVAADPMMQAAAVHGMLVLLRTPVPIDEVKKQLDTLLTSPVLTKGVDTLISLLFDDPKIGAMVSVHLETLIADPSVRADFEELVDHW